MVNHGPEAVRSSTGIAQPWLSAPFGVYRTADGWLALSMAPLAVVGELVARPQLADLDAWLDRDTIKTTLDGVFLEESTQHWLDMLMPQGIWCARCRTTLEAVDELRREASDLIVEVEHPAHGRLELIGCPVTLSATPWSLRLPPPQVGEHTEEILSSVLSGEELASLMTER